MFTISCYALHPLASRFVRLRRRVHVVTECLVCVVATVCCPCCETMPMSTSISCRTKPSELIEAVQKATIDPGRTSGEPFRPQHLTIDFTPSSEDNSAVENKCQQFWEYVASQPKLDDMVVKPDPKVQPKGKAPSKESPRHGHDEYHIDVSNEDHFPAIHAVTKIEHRGAVKAALNSQL